MPGFRHAWFTSVLLAVGMASGAAGAATKPPVTLDDIACAAYGHKRPGTEADRGMASMIESRFKAAGLDTRVETFNVPRFDIAAATLTQLAPARKDLVGTAFAYSGVGTVEGEVVYVGTGRESDYAGKDAKGKIVMVKRDEAFHRSSQLNEIVAQGGAAMLYVSGSPSNLIQIGAVRFAQDVPSPIPTLTVGATDGAPLVEAAQDGTLKMRLVVNAKRVNAVGRNVIGVLKGSKYPNSYVVVGAHYDSWYNGAIDNCSAAATLLQMADGARSLKPAYTVIFAGWDAEEIGLVGSSEFVRRHPDIVDNTVVNQNLEMDAAAGRGDSLNIIFGTSSPALNGVVQEAGLASGYAVAGAPISAVRAISGGIIPTDLNEFYARGRQGFSTYASTPYYHTTEDTPDKINSAGHERVTAFSKRVLTDLQNVAPDAFTAAKEVPDLTVSAPAKAALGDAVEVTVRLRNQAGAGIDGAPVRINLQYRDWWPAFAGTAKSEGGGEYRFKLPAGSLHGGRNWVQATASDPSYLAKNWAAIDVPAAAVPPQRLRTTGVRILKGRQRLRVTAVATQPLRRWRAELRTLTGRRLASVVRTPAARRRVLPLRPRRPLARRTRYVVVVTAITKAGFRLTARRIYRVA